MTNDLTVGRPGKILLRFCMPLFISAIFQQLYNMADSIIAGRLADGVLKGGGAMKHFMFATFADLGLRVILVFILKPLTFPDPNGIWLAKAFKLESSLNTLASLARRLAFIVGIIGYSVPKGRLEKSQNIAK